MGLARADVRVGDEIEWVNVPSGVVATSYNFGGAVTDYAALRQRFAAGGEVSKAYGTAMTRYMTGNDIDRALNGLGVLPIQLRHDTYLEGNMMRRGTAPELFPTTAQAGEVLWVLLPGDCSGTPDRVIAVRKVCGNPVLWE